MFLSATAGLLNIVQVGKISAAMFSFVGKRASQGSPTPFLRLFFLQLWPL